MAAKRTLNVGLIGYRFMGRAHSNAWRQVSHFFDLPANIQLNKICGRERTSVAREAKKLGWSTWATDWREVVEDPGIDIVDICAPNDVHCQIALAAARSGKAILCEKPLARTFNEAQRMVAAVKKARVPNMICYNYRRVPAVALARQVIDRGEIGRIFHFRARYAQDWIVDPKFPLVWRLQSGIAGSGAVGDLLSHVVDLARYLIGEFKELAAATETFVKRRPLSAGDRKKGKVTVDDAVTVIGRFRNGALASLGATRFAPGRKNSMTFEINGSEGSLFFDLEEMNRLQFFSRRDPENRQGFRDILVTEQTHPYIKSWWPPGHVIGYEHTFTHTVADFVQAVLSGRKAAPDFADGLQTQQVLDAVVRSAKSNSKVKV